MGDWVSMLATFIVVAIFLEFKPKTTEYAIASLFLLGFALTGEWVNLVLILLWGNYRARSGWAHD